LQEATAGASVEHVDEEYVALLCEGNIEQIPAEDRAAILAAVASDPELAELVKELGAAGLGTQKRINDPAIFALQAATWTWAAAACAVVLLGIFRMMSPAGPHQNIRPQAVAVAPNSSSPQSVNPSNAENPLPQTQPPQSAPPPPQAVESTTPPPSTSNWRAQDILFYLAVVALVLLTLPAMMWLQFARWRRRGIS
jgi:hypothetical protein